MYEGRLPDEVPAGGLFLWPLSGHPERIPGSAWLCNMSVILGGAGEKGVPDEKHNKIDGFRQKTCFFDGRLVCCWYRRNVFPGVVGRRTAQATRNGFPAGTAARRTAGPAAGGKEFFMEAGRKDLAALLPNIAAQARGTLSSLRLAAAQLAPMEAREKDPVLD